MSDGADRPWAGLFPFDEPYPQQVDAIDRLLDVLADDGWLAMEGACGTGKTLVALVAGLHAVRADSVDLPDRDGPVPLPEFERVFAVTPVKQQLAQFVAEVRAINRETAAAPVDGLVLRGLGDTLAYAQADGVDLDEAWARVEGPRAETFADRLGAREPTREAPPLGAMVDDLRENAADLIAAGSPVDLRWDAPAPSECSADGCRHLTRPDDATRRCPFHLDADDDADAPWHDAVRARRVCELVETGSGDRLVVRGAETPYPARLVRAFDVADPAQELLALGWDDPFDPFYVRALVDPTPVSFSDGAAGVLDRDDLVPAAAAAGHCPHRTMGDLLPAAEAVVGNYMHLYDPETRGLTAGRGEALDEGTVAVVDEAHVVEDRVREVCSDDASVYTLDRARTDVERAGRVLRGDGLGSATGDEARRARQVARELVGDVPDGPLTPDDFETAARVLDWLLGWVGDRVEQAFAEGLDVPADGERTVALAPPGERAADDLTTAIRDGAAPVELDELDRVATVCRAAAAIHDTVDVSARTPVSAGVGALLAAWTSADPLEFFRELRVAASDDETPPDALPAWAERATASLGLYNCIPDGPVADVYSELGGGVAMSATLEPLDVYRRAAGLERLERGVASDPLHPEAGRRVETARYDLAFPAENRATWGVPLERFTYRNRGEPTTDREAMTSTRRDYAHAIERVAASHGNVLLCLPNYREAEWAADLLAGVEKPVYLDRSSTSDETTALLERFFDPTDHAVLVTSALGTVTEGVDYDGEKLHAACVVGVPYRNTQTPRAQAVRGAYDAVLADEGRSGFEMAVAVPAVRKARQAIGRVIRGPDERGLRILVDERYLQRGSRGVGDLLSEQEFAELRRVGAEMLDYGFDQFWAVD
ncbi:MAG: helicase C-terminal domain-containing protein [Haloferacaceae archaeon]